MRRHTHTQKTQSVYAKFMAIKKNQSAPHSSFTTRVALPMSFFFVGIDFASVRSRINWLRTFASGVNNLDLDLLKSFPTRSYSALETTLPVETCISSLR